MSSERFEPIRVKIPEGLSKNESLEYLKNLLPKEKQDIFNYFIKNGLLVLEVDDAD